MGIPSQPAYKKKKHFHNYTVEMKSEWVSEQKKREAI